MIPLLGPADPFPRVDSALSEPNGLLAAGGGLDVARLIDAYSHGIFPWFSDGDPVLWWCPDPRMVLRTDAVHISHSLRRRLRRTDYKVTMDRAFPRVLQGCAAPRRQESGTWLVPAMIRAYQRLHDVGVAHSIEVWKIPATRGPSPVSRGPSPVSRGPSPVSPGPPHGERSTGNGQRAMGELAGGLYGVALGRMFFGESMFSEHTDGSKVAIVVLAAQLARWGFPLIDCQMQTTHLMTLGAMNISRREFVRSVQRLVQKPAVPPPWRLDEDLIASFR